MQIIYLIVSFGASLIGAICGIGGGIIIRPILDILKLDSISTISFLSSCTVFAMSLYSVLRTFITREVVINIKIATPIAIGAIAGGVIGQNLFQLAKKTTSFPDRVGIIQSALLALITFGTLIYTLKKNYISTYSLSRPLACFFIGMLLGTISSFLGIGGGPINLITLYFFFSLDVKTAAQTSLYIILFSQISNIITMYIERKIPYFDYSSLILMILGGIFGGMVGRKLFRKMNDKSIERLFASVMVAIIFISICNIFQYARVD